MWKFLTNVGAEKKSPASAVAPSVRLEYTGGGTPIPNGVWTVFSTWTTKNWDTDNMQDPVTNPGRVTIRHAGKYLIEVNAAWAANVTGGRGVQLRRNGGNIDSAGQGGGGSADGFSPSASFVLDLAVGEYIEFALYQSSGGALNVAIVTFSMTKIDGAVVSSVAGGVIGQEIAYNEFLSTVPISATTEATSTSIIAAPSFTADGVASYMIDAFIPEVILAAAAGAGIVFTLWDNGVELGRMGACQNVAATTGDHPVRMARRLTPTAGPHVYSLRGFSFGGGSSSVQAGNGGVGLDLPGFIRVVRAA
jgi:hypothetical protein